jgi:WD40 repeat protein
VTTVLSSKDGQTLYSGGQDGTLKLWNRSLSSDHLLAAQAASEGLRQSLQWPRNVVASDIALVLLSYLRR